MGSQSQAVAALSTKMTSSSDVLERAPAAPATIVTRRQLARTSLGDAQTFVGQRSRSESAGERTSIVTRRQGWLKRRRRKRIAITVAVMLGIFPPIWVVYFVSWLVWRSRPKQKSMRLVRRAIRALGKDQTGVALSQLQEAHYFDPSNRDALYWLGLVLSQQDRQEEAAEALSIVSEHVPGMPEVEAALVDAYVSMDEPENAIYHAQKLFNAAPYASASLLKLAEAFDAAGRLDMAIEALRKAPLHKRILTGDLLDIHYQLGTFLQRQGDPDLALQHFKRVYANDISYRDVKSRVAALEEVQNQ